MLRIIDAMLTRLPIVAAPWHDARVQIRGAALALALVCMPATAHSAPESKPLVEMQREADRARDRGQLDLALELWQKIGAQLGGAPALDRMLAAGEGSQILLEAGQVASARTWSDTELDVIMNNLGTRSIEYGFALLHRAEIERRAGEYGEALRRLDAARDTLVAAGQAAPVRATILRARILLDLGDLVAAEREAVAAMDVARAHEIDRPLDLAAAAAALGRVHLEAGAYASARALLQLAVDYERAVFHRAHPRVCEHLVALAEAQIALGLAGAADQNVRTALMGHRLAWPQDGLPIAEVAATLGHLFTTASDPDLARDDLSYALDLLGKTVAPRHRLRARVSLRLAELELDEGNLDAARSHLAEAAGKRIASDPLRVRWLVLQARAHRLGGEADAAAKDLAATIASLDSLAAASRVDVLDEHAEILAARGQADAAAQARSAAVATARKVFGDDHARVAELLRAEARLHIAAGRVPEATRLLGEAEAIHERVLAQRLSWGSERHKRSFVRSLAAETDDIVELALGKRDANAMELAASTILRRKGRVLDALTDDLDVLRRRASEPDRQLLARMQRLRARVASDRLQGPGELEYPRWLDALAENEATLGSLEATVSRRTTEFQRLHYRVDAKNVAAALPDGGLLLEYYRYRTASGEARYAVFAIADDGTIDAVDLGPASAIEGNAAALRAALSRSDGAYEAPARKGWAQLLQPVAARFAKAKTIFVSPDSSLNLVPFAALVDERGAFFLDGHASSYVSSGRDLLAMREHKPPRTGAVLFADPEFGRHRSAGPTEAPLSAAEFPALPGTAREADALAKILVEPKVFTRADATEARLREVAGPSILHLATHGFFLGAPQPGAADTRGIVWVPPERAPARVDVDDPLLRSGLALSGANVHVASENDGVITASELLSLDLHGTQLVVLSACETGVGELEAGEGVYGLRRSLVVAGTATQVMSLWKVDDKATEGLMVAFYERLLRGKLGRAASMREAQLAVRRDRPHPYYWAGFIVSGNPTPMPADARGGPPEIDGEGCRCRTSDPIDAAPWWMLVIFTVRRRSSRTRRSSSRTPART
jgi:CHAT domain-containing protein